LCTAEGHTTYYNFVGWMCRVRRAGRGRKKRKADQFLPLSPILKVSLFPRAGQLAAAAWRGAKREKKRGKIDDAVHRLPVSLSPGRWRLDEKKREKRTTRPPAAPCLGADLEAIFFFPNNGRKKKKERNRHTIWLPILTSPPSFCPIHL